MLQAIDECTTVAALNGYPLPEQVLTGTQGLLLDEASTWAASVIRNIDIGASLDQSRPVVGTRGAGTEYQNLHNQILLGVWDESSTNH
jgi:hypothetical protein